jgi:hypothetical protein
MKQISAMIQYLRSRLPIDNIPPRSLIAAPYTHTNYPNQPTTMTQQDYKFTGWLALDPSAADGKMVWQEFEPKTWEETDIDIKISHCGVCGTDLHTLRSGWVRFPSFTSLHEDPLMEERLFTDIDVLHRDPHSIPAA